jgi:hypothetical protein
MFRQLDLGVERADQAIFHDPGNGHGAFPVPAEVSVYR